MFPLTLLFLALAAAPQNSQSNSSRLYKVASACSAISLVGGGANNIQSESPDESTLVCVKQDKNNGSADFTDLYMSMNGRLRLLRRYEDIGPSGPVSWSADSKAFIFHWTAGGAVGQWYIDAFDARTGKNHPLAETPARKMAHDNHCGSRWDVNRMFLKWASTDSILVVLEWHEISSGCAHFPADRFYEIEVHSDRVVRQITGPELHDLQREFKGQY